MEKIHCICVMRDLMRALASLEESLSKGYGISLYEAMALCSIGKDTVTASAVSHHTGLRPSHLSKILSSLERKSLLERRLGEVDRRQMFFTLTEQGTGRLERIKAEGVEIPALLKPFFE